MYHASRNRFSKWLFSRGLFSLGRDFRNMEIGKFDSFQKMREYMIKKFDDYRMISGQGVLARFSTENYNKYIWFAKMGDGSIGGKARGLAFVNNMLQKYNMLTKYPGIKVVVMGDMNDNPYDRSMVEFLHSKENPQDVGQDDFFSPFWSMLKAGYGSLAYQGVWNIYDIILVNEALLNSPDGGVKIRPVGKKGFYGVVYKKPFMITQSGQYKGTPFRTFSNGSFIGGYSDHLPTYIVLEK